MPKWKKCPNCGGYIPESWNKHSKCGWNVEEEETKKDEFIDEMEKSIKDSFDVLRRIREKYPEEVFQLDPTKIALTMFIQRRREKLIGAKVK
ncbi:MAG: hypothetical protein QXQ77_02355 [Candidatus Aenigmatarchaeota archaeon]